MRGAAGFAGSAAEVSSARGTRVLQDPRRTAVGLACVIGLLSTMPTARSATAAVVGGYEDRRAQTGVRLFRSMLAADLRLDEKRTADAHLLVLFVHGGDEAGATQLADAFAKRRPDGSAEPIRGYPLRIQVARADAVTAWTGEVPAGIFVAERPGLDPLRQLVRYGIRHGRIVYSPFEGHVEDGVLGGLAIEAQVRPYVNLTTLAASNVTLKDFFLKIAKVHR